MRSFTLAVPFSAPLILPADPARLGDDDSTGRRAARCARMGSMSTPLISAAELAAELAADRGSDLPGLLDVRWTLAGGDREGYHRARIPGAVFVDLDRDLAAAPGPAGRHPLPDPPELQRVWRAAGMDDDTQVVVYDGGNGLGSARAWWLLRWSGLHSVRVLDGGLAAWTAETARPLEHGDACPRRPGSVTVRAGRMPIVDADQAGAIGAEPGAVLLDARAPERFRGEVEPIDPVAGHIPGAVNLPIARLVTPAGTYRPAAELAAVLAEVGLTPSGRQEPESAGAAPRAAASCGSGVTACQLVLAGALAGLELALYPGSFSQWCTLGRPVEIGG